MLEHLYFGLLLYQNYLRHNRLELEHKIFVIKTIFIYNDNFFINSVFMRIHFLQFSLTCFHLENETNIYPSILKQTESNVVGTLEYKTLAPYEIA